MDPRNDEGVFVWLPRLLPGLGMTIAGTVSAVIADDGEAIVTPR